jgi:hypothetical protein
MTGVDRGSGWAAVIYALPLLAGVIGALIVVGFYAATFAVRNVGQLHEELEPLNSYPEALGRARGVALGVLPVYLATVVAGLTVGGFV